MQALTANASSGPLLRDKSGGGSHNDRLSILRDVPDERFTFELAPLRPLGDDSTIIASVEFGAAQVNTALYLARYRHEIAEEGKLRGNSC